MAEQGCRATAFETRRSQKSSAWATSIAEIPIAT
ncbi:hypothetical protein QLH51_04185 [Sphingomonas sp. 2R-10]|nr:hypothetical protein [Sphingomonas sp. 2R-10]MDJ0276003.1 hypothetical protein [Sphingomonas sp. 2R-10]